MYIGKFIAKNEDFNYFGENLYKIFKIEKMQKVKPDNFVDSLINHDEFIIFGNNIDDIIEYLGETNLYLKEIISELDKLELNKHGPNKFFYEYMQEVGRRILIEINEKLKEHRFEIMYRDYEKIYYLRDFSNIYLDLQYFVKNSSF